MEENDIIYEGILFFDTNILQFKEMKSKKTFEIKINSKHFDGNNLNFVNRDQGHCFIRGRITSIDHEIIASGLYSIPDWYLELDEFIPLDSRVIAFDKPNLSDLLQSPMLIGEIKVKTCLQKTGKDVYFILYVKLFSQTVNLLLRIVCLGSNQLYINLLYNTLVLDRNYIFTNLRPSKFRVENTSNYYSAYLISSSTEILLLTIPLLRELRPLMGLYDPKVDEKYDTDSIDGLLSVKGRVTRVTREYYELDNSIKFYTCFMNNVQNLGVDMEIEIDNAHCTSNGELVGCQCTSITITKFSPISKLTLSKPNGLNFYDLKLKLSLKRLVKLFNSKIGTILAFKHDFPMSTVWYRNANNVQEFLHKPECIIDIMKMVGWTYYKTKKSALLDHNNCDIVENRYGYLDFIDLDQVTEQGDYENFVFCVVEAGPLGFTLTDHSNSHQALFIPKLHPSTMGGPHLLLLSKFTLTSAKFIEVTSYTLLTPYTVPKPAPESTSYILTNIFPRQIYLSSTGYTHLISARYSRGIIYIRFRQDHIHISQVIYGTLKLYAPSTSLTLIQDDIILTWSDTCTYEVISTETELPPSISISRVLSGYIIPTAIQDLVTIRVRITSITYKLDTSIALVSDHPSTMIKVYIPTRICETLGLCTNQVFCFVNLMVAVVHGQIVGIFKACSGCERIDKLEEGELVIGSKVVRPLQVMTGGVGMWVIGYPISILKLDVYLKCPRCDSVEKCTCDCELEMEGEAEVIVQDGSLEFVVVLSNFDLVQRVFGFDIGRLRDRCGFERISISFLGNPSAPIDDQDWLIEYCRSGKWMDRFKFRVTTIPGYLSTLFDPESPGNIIKMEFLKPKTFRDLEGETHVTMALKFVKIHVGEVERVDHVQEAFSILNSL